MESSWIFTAAGADVEWVWATVWRPKKWINGVLKVEYFYTESTTSSDDMQIYWSLSTWSTGDTLTGTRDLLSEDDTIATQNASNKLWKQTWSKDTSPAVDTLYDTDELIGVGTGRDASDGDDDYAGNLRFHGALLTYVPTNRQ